MQVKVEVTLEIDTDQLDELTEKGEGVSEIDKRVRDSITLKPSNERQPVNEISEIRIIKYF